VSATVQVLNILRKAWYDVAGIRARISIATTTFRARKKRSVRVFSSDHAQRIAVKIRPLDVHVHSSRNTRSESPADFTSQSSACFRA